MKNSRNFTDVCENVKIRWEVQENRKLVNIESNFCEISESGDYVFSFRMNTSIQSLVIIRWRNDRRHVGTNVVGW